MGNGNITPSNIFEIEVCAKYEVGKDCDDVQSEITFDEGSWDNFDPICNSTNFPIRNDLSLTYNMSLTGGQFSDNYSQVSENWCYRADKMQLKLKGWKERAERLGRIDQLLRAAAQTRQALSDEEYEQLYDELNHENETYHDDEIKAGIATALCLVLENLIKYPTNRDMQERACTEMENICALLKIIFGCSEKCREESYNEIGHEVVNLLIMVLDKCTSSDMFAHDPSLIIENIIKLFCIFVQSTPGCKHTASNDRVFYIFAKTLNTGFEAQKSGKFLPQFAMDIIWIISKIALIDDYCTKISSCREIIDALLLSCRQEELIIETAAVLLNLSASESSHSRLIRHAGFLEVIRYMLLNKEVIVKRRAAGFLKNLASNRDVVMSLISFNSRCIINALLKVTKEETDEKTCQHAVGALKKFTSCGYAEELTKSTGLIDSLLVTATGRKDKLTSKLAADALSDLVSEINHPSPSHYMVLKCLVKACKITNKSTNDKLFLAKALVTQSCVIQNQIPIVKHDGMLEAIAALASSKCPNIQSNMTTTLKNLTIDPANHETIAHSDSMKNMAVLLLMDESYGLLQDATFNIFSMLAEKESNRASLANHTGLLEAMIYYTRTTKNSYNKSFGGLNSILLLTLAFEEQTT